MSQTVIHEKICLSSEKLHSWYESKTEKLAYPIYSSYDVRDSGFKVGIVDANIYPAGFNNICPSDLEECPKLLNTYLEKHYQSNPKRILLVTEEHTQNSFYWENVATIKKLFEEAHYEILVGIPKVLDAPLEVTSASGKLLTIHSAFPDNPHVIQFNPDLIVSNNDFSDAKDNWAQRIALPINPPRELGWYQRKKSNFFKFYNELVEEFCAIADLDPFLLRVKTEEFRDFDITNDESVNLVAERIDRMIDELKVEYTERDIKRDPFIFVKNNSGTYGLAVLKVSSGEEFKSLNYKSRKKMKAAKGGRDVEEVVIQEGIPSVIRAEEATAEPVIYMIGCRLAGGFFRTHKEKSESESLNSPGAVYKRMCISDLAFRQNECPSENVYGWTSKLALLAIAHEADLMNVTFKDFVLASCSDSK
ncbi:MAG: putative glutamate--cysteine ligase [Pseudomonadota bacterium]|jgi:glutamate--cysteine ligase